MTDGTRDELGGLEASLIQARWTARRMVRGRTIWVAWGFAALPLLLAMTMKQAEKPLEWSELFIPIGLLGAILAPMFMASSLAEEIEDKTFTYLWSRPIPRWSVVFGKLLASIPIAGGILCGAAAVCFAFAEGGTSEVLARGIGALLAQTIGMCMVSAGFAILVPRAGMVVTYGYAVLDYTVGWMPFSLRNLSVQHQAREIAGVGGEDKALVWSLVWLLAIGAFWMAVAFWRLGRAEFSTGDK